MIILPILLIDLAVMIAALWFIFD